MKRQSKIFALLFLAALWFATVPLHAEPAPPDDAVFQRSLGPSGTLTATRQEVPYDPPKQPPPAPLVYVKPAHVYLYHFYLVPPHGQQKLLWSHRLQVYPPGNFFATDITVLAADLQGDTLIVVYKDFNKTNGGTTYANITTNASRDNRKELPFPQTNLTHDSDAAGVYVTAAKIEGSFPNKTLTLRLTNVHTFLRYAWQDGKWQEVPGIAAEAPDLTLFLPSLVYEKALPDASYIRVYKKRLPVDPKTVKFLADQKALSPTLSVDQTDYSEGYTYKLEQRGHPAKTLWFQRADHYTGPSLNNPQVVDAAYEDSQLIVVIKFKDPLMFLAMVVDTRKKNQNISQQNSLLVAEADVSEIVPKSAAITGSLAEDTLSVDVTLLGGKHQIFRWKDSKWQKVPDVAEAPGQAGKANTSPVPKP